MKKLRNEKPELSKKSPFYITKHRYYELKKLLLAVPGLEKGFGASQRVGIEQS